MPTDPMERRHTDPSTSDYGVEPNITARWQAVLDAAGQLPQPFDDDALHLMFEHMTNKRIDRGIVARTRLNLERRGYITRQPLMDGETRLTFRLA